MLVKKIWPPPLNIQWLGSQESFFIDFISHLRIHVCCVLSHYLKIENVDDACPVNFCNSCLI